MPIFKNKDKIDITNYRPVSILPVISKVYEKVFYRRLYNYFAVNNLLSSAYFGFRSGASTEHALLEFSDVILKLFEQKKVAIATFMDLSKAFDYVDHNILLSKLKRYDIQETALQWINSYLIVVVVVVVVVGQTVGSISSRTLAYDCLCTLELCTASMIATS